MIVNALKEGAKAGFLALLLFIPITGFLLKVFTIELHLLRPLYLALAVFIGRFLVSWLSETNFGLKLFKPLSNTSLSHVKVVKDHHHTSKLLCFVFLICMIFPFFASKYGLTLAISSLIYVLLGLGLNIVVGLAGLLDLGFVAFYAVGAYGFALGNEYLGLGFWGALPFCALLSATFGAILGFPVLRMHGDYLAIVTLGFGEIIRLVLNNWASFTHGPNGVITPYPTFLGIEFTRQAKQGGIPFHELFNTSYTSQYRYMFTYLILFLVVCLMLKFITRLKRMPIGRAWEALREDEIACRSLGINHVTTKLSAFSLGAMVGGIGGVFFAAFQGFVSPSSFTFIESALILAIVVLGGMGSTVGVVLAAFILTLLPEILRELSHYRMLIFGCLMVTIMIWRPRGLVRIVRQYFNRPTNS